jgi:hypothetical protein
MNRVVVRAVFILCIPSILCAAEERLMPSVESSKINLSFKVDGRAILVTVRNESQLALTAGTLYCAPYRLNLPRPTAAPNGRKWCSSDSDSLPETSNPIADYLVSKRRSEESLALLTNPQFCTRPEPTLFYIRETIIPTKAKDLYFEAYNSYPQLVDCRLQDLRGREKRIWEF